MNQVISFYTNLTFSSNLSGGVPTRINILSDNSGYLISSHSYNTNYPSICKYLFSASSDQWQQINIFSSYSYGELMINDNQVFASGCDPNSPRHVHFLKITVGNTPVDWSTRMNWDNTGWHLDYSEWQLDNSSTYIYSLIEFYNSSTHYLYFLTFYVSDGSLVGSRYRSSTDLGYIYGSARVGNYLLVITQYNYLVLINVNTLSITIKRFSSMSNQWGAVGDASSGM